MQEPTLKHPVLCLMGPTASGKTAVAVELVQHFPCEIISVDSAMVYRGLDLGTAKPSPEILRAAPHRLLDIRDPSEVYSAGEFKRDAFREIKAIIEKGKVPLLVGGTMLYFYILQQGLDHLPEQNPLIRNRLREEAAEKGWPALHAQLAKLDPQTADHIHPHDSQRIQRALEVYALTGKPLRQQFLLRHEGQARQTPYLFHQLILHPSERSSLHKRIEQRFLNMLDLGFMDEVKKLYQQPGLSLEKPAIRSVGYRQAWAYLSGNLSFDEMKENAITATRQLAKRQITWLRKWENVQHFDSDEPKLIQKIENHVKTLL